MSDDEQLVQVVYASRARVVCDTAFFKDLLEKARANNASLGVSGMLLYHVGAFLQVLEGPPAVVAALYEKIERDTRHDRVVVLHRADVDARSFAEWSMGLMKSDSKTLTAAQGINEFLTEGVLTLASDSQRLAKVLQGFRAGRWRQNIT